MIFRKKINPDELFVEMVVGQRYRPLRHVTLMVMILGLGISNVYNHMFENWLWILNVLIFIPIPILLNVYLFVPRLLLRNRPWSYTLSVISTVLVSLFFGTVVLQQGGQPPSPYSEILESRPGIVIMNLLSTTMMFALILTGTTSIIIMQMWLRDRIRIAELEEASNIAELEMLKNQINPHFLFNMLNNAIVLARDNSLMAKEVILKLREMLNYQFEMSHVDRIPLQGDIDFIHDLLHLEQIRRDKFDYRILVTGETEGIVVPPLIFIPFVENAIKHGNDNTRPSYMLLVFNIDRGKLNFFCTNSVPLHAENIENGGIGLKNITRRLELIYGKDHYLDINGTSQTYNVNLTIGL